MNRLALATVILLVAAGHQPAIQTVVEPHGVREHCRHCDGALLAPGRTRMGRRVEHTRILLEPTRARIHHLIRDSSGLTVTQLARRLQVNNSSVAWHLKKLIAAGLVTTDATGPTPCYRSPAHLQTPVAEAIRLVHSAPARELVVAVEGHPGQHLGELAATLGAPRSRYWRVVQPLVESGLLRFSLDGRRQRLFVTNLAREALRQTAKDRVLTSSRRRIREPS